MENTNIDFAQVQSFPLLNKNISNTQFRIYSLLELYRFRKETEITSLKIANDLGLHHDTVRRELNKMNEVFEGFISFHFIRKYYGQPDEIIVHFNYLTTEIKIISSNKNILAHSERCKLDFVIKQSKYFAGMKAQYLYDIVKPANIEELIKSIIYINQKSKIKNPIGYIKKSFKDGYFVYDKIIISPSQLKEYLKVKTDSKVFFAIDYNNAERLKKVKTEDYKFYTVKDAYHIIIYRCTYRTKKANIKNALDKFEIDYKIYLME